MTVNKINVYFEKIGRFQIKHRTAFLIAIALITLAGFAGLPRFKSEDDEDQWITNSKEQKAANDRFKELFGNTDVVAVLVEADDVFDPEVLSAIDRLGKRRDEGLTTPKQIRLLEGRGFRRVGTWRFDEASAMISRIAALGWRRTPPGVDPAAYVPPSLAGSEALHA